MTVNNPWKDQITPSKLFLDIDKPFLEAHNSIRIESPDHQLDFRPPPVPFLGFHNAPVVILLANPGLDDDANAIKESVKSPLFEPVKANLDTDGGTAHFALGETFRDTPGGKWWRARTAKLGDEVGGFPLLAERLLAIELHGYHSKSWSAPLANFPSQEFSFYLVRKAIERGALIVIARSRKYWLAAVPELLTYNNVIRETISPRAVHLSEGNLGPIAYAKLVKALKD